MPDIDKITRGWERCLKHTCPAINSKEYAECEYTLGLYCQQDKLIRETIRLLKQQDALIRKACETISDTGIDVYCDDLMCDDGWCEEHCKTAGVTPECIDRWLRKQVANDQ